MFFDSLESGSGSPPALILHLADSTQVQVPAILDSHVDKSTAKTQAASKSLRLSSDGKYILIAFKLPENLNIAGVTRAVLRLRLQKADGKRPFTVDVFAANPGGGRGGIQICPVQDWQSRSTIIRELNATQV